MGIVQHLRSRKWLVTFFVLPVLIAVQVAAAGIDVAEFINEEGASLASLVELTDVGLGIMLGWLIYR